MIDRIGTLEKEYRSICLKYRRDLHANPELSHQEKRTSAKVTEILENLGMEVTTGIGGTGVAGLLRGNHDGRTVGLRADMDALSISENTGVPFASQNAGVMHACGHDAHTAILLATAHVLSDMRNDIHGNVKFVFQPAEEDSPHGGAPGMIADGVLDSPRVDAMLALHVWPTLKTGTIGILPGAISAASDRLHITILGKSSHAAFPEGGVDSVVASAQVVTAIQSIVSRNVSALDSAVISLGKINGGSRYNIIADRVELDGTVRTFNPEVQKKIAPRIERVVRGTTEAMGADCLVEYLKGYPSTINDPEITAVVRKSIIRVAGEAGLLEDITPAMGGEDFSFFSQKVPSTFVWLGCCPSDLPLEEMPPLHNDKFLPDEKCFPYGVRYLAMATLDLLNS